MFGKMINGELYGAPKKLDGDGVTTWNPPAEMYLEQGWKPVVFTEPPGEPPVGYEYEPGWEEQGDIIAQIWTLLELPDDIDEAEAYDIIFGGGGE